MRKNPHAVALGKIGGKARTPAKQKAGRRNIAHARKYLLTKKLCRVCRKNHLGPRNKSGVCRKCQRKGARGRVSGVRGKRLTQRRKGAKQKRRGGGR